MKIIKLISFLIYFSLPYHIFCQEITLGGHSVILWNDNYKLERNDFNKVDNYRDPLTDFKNIDALMNVNVITFKTVKSNMSAGNAESCILILVYTEKLGRSYNINIVNLFVKNRSWCIGNLSSQLLLHEQIHFDISEYYVRLIRSYLSKQKFRNRSEAKAFIELFMGMYLNTQKLFDLESNTGRNFAKQKKWRQDIQKKIKLLGEYSQTEFTQEQLTYFEQLINLEYQ